MASRLVCRMVKKKKEISINNSIMCDIYLSELNKFIT